MTKSKLPANLHIVQERPPTPSELVTLALGRDCWLSDPANWSRNGFIDEVERAMRESHGMNQEIDRFLIALVASQAEIYVRCWRDVETQGLTIMTNSGQTHCKNPSVAIGDRALRQVVHLLDELGVTPKNRRPRKGQGPYAALLEGP